MILRSQLFRKTVLFSAVLLLISSFSFAQYAATDYYYVDESAEWESVLGGNPDLSFEVMEKEKLNYGSHKAYHSNGQLAEKIDFKNGKENGEATFYYANGQVAMSGQYKDGQMVGLWKFFTPEGHIPSGDWKWEGVDAMYSPSVKGQLLYGKPYGSWIYKSVSNEKEIKITFE